MFTSERQIKKTRKVHRCEACDRSIKVGSAAAYWAGISDGEFYTAHFHTDCRVAELALNRMLHGFYDDWISLHTIDEQEDWDWLQENYPAIFARVKRLDLAQSTTLGETA
jgi:hypothetical protein